MVDHRRTPGRKAYVLPGWFLTLTAAACVVGLIGLGWVIVFGPSDDATPSAAPSTTPSATPTPTPIPTPSPSESPTPSPTPTPTVSRADIDVTILNSTRIKGLARQVSARVSKAGWTVRSVGNWRSASAESAVYFPQGHKPEARLLAKDLGIDAVQPVVTGMRTDRLTVVLLGLP